MLTGFTLETEIFIFKKGNVKMGIIHLLDNETINTINTFFDCGLNISETGRVLYLHRNTLVYRLDKFSRSTGLDIRNFDDAVKCRVGMMISAYLRNQPLQNEKSDI